VCDVTAARVTNVHVTDIGADYVSVTWDALVPATGSQFVIYEARCVDVDRLISTDEKDNHTEVSSSSSSSASLSLLTSWTNATFSKLTVSAKYVIEVQQLLFFVVLIYFLKTKVCRGEATGVLGVK